MPAETSASALFTLATLKDHLGIDSSITTDDTDLVRIGDGVSAGIETLTSRFFVIRAITEILDGAGKPVLKLRHYPVSAVASIQVRADMLSSWVSLVPDDDFELNAFTGFVYLSSATVPTFYRGRRTVQVVYSPGFGTKGSADIPADVVHVGLDYAKFCYTRMKTGAEMAGSITIGAQSISVVPDMPKDMRDKLDKYRKVRL